MKNIENDKKLKDILDIVNFLERFTDIRSQHDDIEGSMKNPDKKEIRSIMEGQGLVVKFMSKGSYFLVKSKDSPWAWIHLDVKRGKVEFILCFEESTEIIGTTYSVLSLVAGAEERIKNPFFKDYEEFGVVLKKCIGIMKDINNCYEDMYN